MKLNPEHTGASTMRLPGRRRKIAISAHLNQDSLPNTNSHHKQSSNNCTYTLSSIRRPPHTSWLKNIVVAATIICIQVEPRKSKVLEGPRQVSLAGEEFHKAESLTTHPNIFTPTQKAHMSADKVKAPSLSPSPQLTK